MGVYRANRYRVLFAVLGLCRVPVAHDKPPVSRSVDCQEKRANESTRGGPEQTRHQAATPPQQWERPLAL
jgi:hypothetical protein